MKIFHVCALSLTLFLLSNTGFSQGTSVPQEVRDNFNLQYPTAKNAQWGYDIVNVNVKFELDGEWMTAEYSRSGTWKRTLKDWSYDKLIDDVKDGFQKSKYADREVTEVKKVYLPGNVEQYRLKVEKNEFPNKLLYFNKSGRLIRNVISV